MDGQLEYVFVQWLILNGFVIILRKIYIEEK